MEWKRIYRKGMFVRKLVDYLKKTLKNREDRQLNQTLKEKIWETENILISK